MQFINIVVHSVDDMNFRAYLQYELTSLGLDKYLDVSITESLYRVVGGGKLALFHLQTSFPDIHYHKYIHALINMYEDK